MKTIAKFWIGIAILIALSPLGLILPEHFKASEAWGEWSPEKIREMAGYIPYGLEKLSELWLAPIPDYVFRGCEGKGMPQLSIAYLVSAILGIAITAVSMFFLGKLLTRK